MYTFTGANISFIKLFLRVLGTRMYMPPEFVRFGWYDICQATVWTLGMILVNMIASSMPFLDPEQALRRPPRLPDYISQG